MEFSAFSEGTAQGGLREKPQIKLWICYLFKMLDRPITRGQISEILQEYPIANYFEVNEGINELVKNSMLLCEIQDGQEVLIITHKAKYQVSTIERSLPKSIREKSVSAGIAVLTRDKIKSESEVTVEQKEDGYYVTFLIKDVGTELMKLTIYVADSSQVEIVKRNFFSNAPDIYSNMISSLTVEE